MQIFQNVIYFQIQSFYDVSMTSEWRQNRYFSRPCNFAIFECRNSEFGTLGYFDMFIKVSVFRKYYFICWYFIAETVPDTNDVRMTSSEIIHFILVTRTDHRVTRKWKLLSISDLFLVYPNNEIRTPKFHKFDILWRQCDVMKHLLLL